jgi:hypothetical protein
MWQAAGYPLPFFFRYVPIRAAAQFQQALCRAQALGGIQICQRMTAGHKDCFLICYPAIDVRFRSNIPVADFPVIINVNFQMAFRLRDGYLLNENCQAVIIFRCDVFRDGNGRTRADRQRQPVDRMQGLYIVRNKSVYEVTEYYAACAEGKPHDHFEKFV